MNPFFGGRTTKTRSLSALATGQKRWRRGEKCVSVRNVPARELDEHWSFFACECTYIRLLIACELHFTDNHRLGKTLRIPVVVCNCCVTSRGICTWFVIIRLVTTFLIFDNNLYKNVTERLANIIYFHYRKCVFVVLLNTKHARAYSKAS